MSNDPMTYEDFINFMVWFTIIFGLLWWYIIACFRAAKKNPKLAAYYRRGMRRQGRFWGNQARDLGNDVQGWWER